MFDKWRQYSYAAQKERRLRFLRILLLLALFFAAYVLISTYLVRTVRIGSSAMEPNLESGDRLLVFTLAYGLRRPGKASESGSRDGGGPKRGDVVLVDSSLLGEEEHSFFFSLADEISRFFTLQRYGVKSDGSGSPRYRIERVVGLPGDELSMHDFVLTVRGTGEAFALTEFELSSRPYDIRKPELPSGWNAELPLSASFAPLTLDAQSYFLLADDRSFSGDSRTLGPVPLDAITGKVILRYWPPARFKLF